MPTPASNQVTELLALWSKGDGEARERLLPVVYNELRNLARRCLGGQRRDQTLQSTALVHEAYLRLVNVNEVQWEDRAHFFAVAAQMMRRILVDHARARHAAKRGGGQLTLLLDDAVALPRQHSVDLIALDDALTALAALDRRQSQIVELRFFAGLSIEDAARVLAISPATVKREWATARAWLRQETARTSAR